MTAQTVLTFKPVLRLSD